MKQKFFYDADVTPGILKGKTVGIIGYGIQGRAQALNLRDSGLKVLIGNRKDSYLDRVQKDGFDLLPFDQLALKADLLCLLIPDQAHQEVYEQFIAPNLRPQKTLLVAHGYSLHYKEIRPRKDLDVVMCAPRMPGKQLREYYLRGSGVPAFADVFQDATGQAWQTTLGFAKACGFTKAGVVAVSVQEEAEIDLLVEQFLIPNILKAIHTGFDCMVTAGFSPLPALMELYASGELGEVLYRAAEVGLYKTFEENASPTCQFGITQSYDSALKGNPKEMFAQVLQRIRSEAFRRSLGEEGNAGYPLTRALWDKMEKTDLANVHHEIQEKIWKNLSKTK